ncbi:MAG: sulfate permease [Candidatus Nanopelagicales bacterium]
MSTTTTQVSWFHRTFPGLSLFTKYRRRWLRGDVLAGITVAAYLVPQVMAYATIAGLPPVTGLWTIIPAFAVYGLLGSSRQLSIGPESTTALMTAATIGPLAGGDPVRYAALAAALALVVGLLCIVCWIARLGFIADLFSRPILVGYMAGIALIMIVGQLDKVTGVPVEGDEFLAELSSFFTNITKFEVPTLIFGVFLLALLLLIQLRWPRVPGPLLVVLLATAMVHFFDLGARGIEVIGPIPEGLPTPQLPGVGDMYGLLLPAFGVLLVGYTDNVLTARSFATKNAHTIDANQEFLALGTANVGAGLFQGFPISSSASRTALGAAAGSRTQLYSWVALACTIAVLLFAGPVLAEFPKVALGAIVIYAALRLIDIAGFRQLARFRRNELLLAFAALAGVLVFGILYGILVSVALSVAELLWRTARPHDAVEGFVPDLAGMHDVDDYPSAATVPGLLVYRYDSPLFFANADNFRNRAMQAVDENRPVRWFVLNAEANVEVDITALGALEALRSDLERKGIRFGLARAKTELLADLRAYGFIKKIGDDMVFPTLPTAVEAYRTWSEDNPD